MIKWNGFKKAETVEEVSESRVDLLARAMGLVFSEGAYVNSKKRAPYGSKTRKGKAVNKRAGRPAAVGALISHEFYDEVRAMAVGDTKDVTDTVKAAGISYSRFKNRMTSWVWIENHKKNRPIGVLVTRSLWRVIIERTA